MATIEMEGTTFSFILASTWAICQVKPLAGIKIKKTSMKPLKKLHYPLSNVLLCARIMI